jgi:Phage integrase family
VHDLRHACASLLIREGASIKAVQHHLGHKSAAITLDRYGHLFPEELATWPIGWTGSTRRLVCTQRVPRRRWPPSGKGKGLVGYQALLVEVGRLELHCTPHLRSRSGAYS